MTLRTILGLSCLAVCVLATSARADSSAKGSDMWTGFMERQDLFRPHDDFCDAATEAFVSVTPNGEGFCIEKSERTAANWKDARHTCVSSYKRLPEPGEWVYACAQAGTLGLSNMTNNYEWISNFVVPLSFASNNFGHAVPTAGSGSCTAGGFGQVAWYLGGVESVAYRCVR